LAKKSLDLNHDLNHSDLNNS